MSDVFNWIFATILLNALMTSSMLMAQEPPEQPIVPIAEYRRRLNALEIPLLQLAEKARNVETSLGKDHPESLKQRARLRESIQKTFATRQEIQRAELTEFARRLSRMQQSIDARDRIADKVIDRRLEELLDPEASWDDHSGRSSGSLLRQKVAEPKPFQGRGAVSGLVQSVSGTEVQISLGIDDGIQPRDRFAVLSGLDAENVIEITAIQQDCSIARILTESEEFRISVGDQVVRDVSNSPIRIRLLSDRNFEMQWRGMIVRSPSTAEFEIPSNKTSELQMCRIQGADDLEVRMAIEPRYSSPEALQFLQHNAMVIEVKDADIDQLKDGKEVTKVLCVSPGSTSVSAIATFAIDNGVVPVDEVASGHGMVIGVIRMSRIEPASGVSVSERIPELAAASAEDGTYFQSAWRPKSDAEKAIGRLVLVFSQDQARRAVPALLIQHGQETIALTAGPATIVPENIAHAIDRTFLEFYDRENVPTTYADFSTPDLVLHVSKEQVTSFRLENPVAVKTGDILSAILMRGQADFEVTANAARITAVEQKATWLLPSHELNREFTGLIQIDQRFPEGTPLFKDGELAGITLLGTRFMKRGMPGSYVVPASRIVEVLQQLKTE